MNIDYETIGMTIRFFRLQSKMSQEVLAEQACVSRVFISSIERGEKSPSLETLVCIANALHVSVDDLLSSSLNDHGQLNSRQDPFLDCTPEEFNKLMDVVVSLKTILRQHKISE